MRVETGVRAGDAISPFYDPMIAKLVVHGADRPAALDALAEALEATEIAGSVTNVAFLAALARDPDFAVGRRRHRADRPQAGDAHQHLHRRQRP